MLAIITTRILSCFYIIATLKIFLLLSLSHANHSVLLSVIATIRILSCCQSLLRQSSHLIANHCHNNNSVLLSAITTLFLITTILFCFQSLPLTKIYLTVNYYQNIFAFSVSLQNIVFQPSLIIRTTSLFFTGLLILQQLVKPKTSFHCLTVLLLVAKAQDGQRYSSSHGNVILGGVAVEIQFLSLKSGFEFGARIWAWRLKIVPKKPGLIPCG